MTTAPIDVEPAVGVRRRAPASKGGALVIGAEYRGLGIVRSLGRRGIPVWVLEDSNDVIASASRYARRSLRFPTSDDDRMSLLMQLADEYGLESWTIYPTGDETAAFVARHHDVLARRFVLITPRWDTLAWAYDKRLTHELAASLGIDHPKTRCPENRHDLRSLDLQFPLILKPATKPEFNRLTAAKAWRVDDLPTLLQRYDDACTLMDPRLLMVQEIIPGGGESQFSYAAVCAEGRPLATAVARRTRQYPADFGRASTFVETVDCPEIIAPSVRLLNALRFDGLVELEFKHDHRDGKFKLLDINPRAWGWHTLCARAGVDFPYLAWEVARGREIPPMTTRPGVRWVRTTTDLPTAVREILRGRLSWRAYTNSLRGPVESAIFAKDDPLPGVVEIPLLVRMLVSRLRRGDGV